MELYFIETFSLNTDKYFCVGSNHSKIFFFKLTEEVQYSEAIVSQEKVIVI